MFPIAQLFYQLPILLFSITVHEYCHGIVAEKKGDDTARVLGRLTLNPIAHIDLFGTILLPLLAVMMRAPIFGWAKPVPINPYNLKNPRKDMMHIGLAGPVANFSLAVISAFLLRFIDSSGLFHSSQFVITIMILLRYLLIINVILAVFNLIPVPPLDGSRIISGLLPTELAYKYEKLTPYGFLIIIVLLSTGILWGILGPIISFVIQWLGGRYV